MLELNNILYVTFPDLKEWGVPVHTIDSGCARFRKGESSAWENIANPSNGNQCLVNYDSIPASTKEKHKIPAKDILLASHRLKSIKTEVQSDLTTLNYYLENPQSHDLAHEYTRIAAWLIYCADLSGKEIKAKGFHNTDHFYTTVMQCMNEDGQQYKWRTWGVDSLQVFKRRLKPFNQAAKEPIMHNEALCSLISKKFGIKNAKKTNEHFERCLLLLFVNKGTGIKMLPEQIYVEYEQIRQGRKSLVDIESGEVILGELPEVCDKTVKNFFRKPEIQIITSKLRDGNKYHNDKFRPYIHRMKPKYSFSMTSSDGETMPFRLIIKNDLTWKRGTAYLIFDVMSEALVGISFGMQENLELMKEAFDNLILSNNGYVPLENQLDNFGRGFEGDLKQLFRFVSFCQPYNPQSKYAERLIAEFEKNHLRLVEGFQGSNIQSVKQSGKKNPDIEEVGYTFDQLKKIYMNAMTAWNNDVPKGSKTGKTRTQTLWENINPECKPMNAREVARIAGENSIISISRSTIIVEYQGDKYKFSVPNYTEIIAKLTTGFRVRVRFLPGMLNERIWIYKFDDPKNTDLDIFLAECAAVDATQAAKAEQTDEDLLKLGRQLRDRTKFDEWVEQKTADIVPVKTIPLTSEEAEGIVNAGYTQKHNMQDAESIAGASHAEMKDDRKTKKREDKKRTKESERLNDIRHQVDESDLVPVPLKQPEEQPRINPRFL